MRSILPLMFLFLSYRAVAQNERNDFSDINTQRSAAHINIPGTKVYVVLPEGYAISKTAAGIEKNGARFIIVSELPGVSFYTNTARIAAQSSAAYFGVLEYMQFKINGMPAKLVVRSLASLKTYSLAFGDSTFCVNMTGFIPADDDEMLNELKLIFRSIYYEASKPLTPLDAAPFKIDDSQSIFKFAEKKVKTYIYTVNGTKGNYDNAPNFTIYTLPYTHERLKEDVAWELKALNNPIIKNASSNKLNGFNCYQREVYGEINGKKIMLFECLVVIGENVVVMGGVADEDFDNYLVKFKDLAATVSENKHDTTP